MKTNFRLLLLLFSLFAFIFTSCDTDEVDEYLELDSEQTTEDEDDSSTTDEDDEDDTTTDDEADEDDTTTEDSDDDTTTEDDDEPVVIPDGYTPIYTAEGMYNVSDDLSGNYILMNDIDLSSYSSWTPIGSSDSSYFSGIFDGGGHTITGLKIDSEDSYQGLFGYVSGGSISNLIIEDAQVSGGEYTRSIATASCKRWRRQRTSIFCMKAN